MAKNDFKVAVDAVRAAFKSALDDPDFDDNILAETWRHFLGLQAIHKRLPDDPEQQDVYFGGLAGDSGAGGYDTISFAGADEGYYAAAPVHLYGAAGQDVITFES